ncbi:CvpA family protein [Bauldia sp.]|uniref:CvpA family protein n=1 Tax=Bauldia sp. TaxID=2575872 RepID=UPI003BAAFDD0
MPVTVLDVIVIVVVLISAVLAMVRGFVREVLSVASWVAAAVAAFFFYPTLEPLVSPYLENQTVAEIAAAAVIFIVVLVIASYITMKISDFVIDSRVGAVDRAFGFVFGAIRGILLLAIALQFFLWLYPNPGTWVTDAVTKPVLDDIREEMIAAMPEDVEGRLFGRFRTGDTEGAAAPALPNDGSADAPAVGDPAYDESERNRIDQLFESSGGN